MIIVDKSVVGPWIAERCNMVWTPENSTAIGLEKNGELVAGVWYEDFNGRSITCHIAIEKQMTKSFLAFIFHYPYIQLGVEKIIAPVMSSNEKSIRLVSNMGFQKEAQLLDVFPDDDLLFFVLTKDKCRFLGESNG